MIKNMVYHNQNYNSLPGNMYSKKSQDSSTVVRANKKDPTLEGGNYIKLVAFGLSNMQSDHQNHMYYSSRKISKDTLIWT